MFYKSELLQYCDFVKSSLNTVYSDAMYRAFMTWAEVMPDENLPVLFPEGDAEGQGFLLKLAPGVDIGFSIPHILRQQAAGSLNIEKRLLSLKDIVFSEEDLPPFKEDDESIFAIDFPVSIDRFLELKPWIIDGNKRISAKKRRGMSENISCNVVEPHSLDIRSYVDIYSHFLTLYTFDMALAVLNEDHAGVIYKVGVEILPRFVKAYPDLINFLRRESS